jgi:hypothetical protein
MCDLVLERKTGKAFACGGSGITHCALRLSAVTDRIFDKIGRVGGKFAAGSPFCAE